MQIIIYEIIITYAYAVENMRYRIMILLMTWNLEQALEISDYINKY
jgi:hypothetical protein